MPGPTLRKYPKMQILRGYNPQDPTTLSISLDVDTTPDAEVILSGQIMSANAAGTAWRLGVDSTSPSNIMGFAEWDSNDYLTRSVAQLAGITCHGQFRIATAFFKRTDGATVNKDSGAITSDGTLLAYTIGTPVTYCADNEIDVTTVPSADANGNYTVKKVVRSCKGFIRPAKTGERVIGMVAYQKDGINGAGTTVTDALHTSNLVPTGVWALQRSISTAIDSTARPENAYLVVIDTCFHPTV